ncbi:hypothetical protein E1A91_D10G250200v1 [Gossypium mustelinum]|uniref:DUF674 domain-containing protein n=4 Tax=Gossypium TaxID=3633 RepID=A0A5J5PVV9_GOSBA|nr:hypothetical protein ES319_D10G245000v1 [Gossypium barbadense]TYG51529.1 hypothetical protein ES288_D10G264600v1 [Gossypium darwinii]TYH51351.1 hypothetical protein ES332_D10G266700v1 [Gossypium tomentosum]TYI62525.1 hypothetical protein E1A91_D10G250200v1 [Gossypium mustelinum]
MLGCLANPYESVEKLSDSFILLTTNKDTLLKPKCSSSLPANVPVSTSSPTAKEGYVKGVITYIIMDDLTVTPISTISIVAMLHKFNLEQVEDLEEEVVNVGMNEGLELLKSPLKSKTVLTDLFLTQKARKKRL